MNEPTLTPDDPRLTAYALGELSGDERAHVEAALRENPALRTAVDEIRATAAHIEAALAAEALEDVPSEETRWSGLAPSRSDVAEPADEKKRRGVKPLHPLPQRINGHVVADAVDAHDRDEYAEATRGGKLLRFPQLYLVVATAAAACFAVYVYLRNDEYKARQQVAETAARIAWQKHEAEKHGPAQNQLVEVSLTPLRTTTESAPENEKTSVARAADGATPPTTVETPPISAPAAQPENGLALLEISKPDQPAIPEATSSPPSLVTFSIDQPAGPVSVSGSVGGVSPSAEKSSAPASKTSPPPAVMPKPAQSNSVAGVPSSTTSVGIAGRVGTVTPFPSSAGTATPPNGEIVVLDKVEVNADRLQNFLSSGAFTNITTVTRGMPEPEPLPRPPPGAQFGSAKEIASYAGDHDFVRVTDNPTSRFSIDVGAANYASIRRLIEQGLRPPPDAVRIEELVNYFPYGYPSPKDREAFAASLEVAAAPWAPQHRLVRIGLKARELASAPRGPANLVFVIDVSASMADANKLPLVRDALRLLVSELRPDDHVAIVTCASRPVVALPSTPVSRTSEILAAIAAIKPAGVTEAATGLQVAYRVAIGNFTKNGANRVILCTDGAFNLGMTSEHDLLRLMDEKTKTGIALTLLGFGRANEQSTPLERLAHKAGASYGYVDSRREAEKFLVDQVRSSLATIARDVKVQVDFNPAKVLAYRLIGYENRPLRREAYSEETSAAGEVGAGQAVTALYEIIPALPGDAAKAKSSDYVKYGAEGLNSSRLEMPDTQKPPGPELLTVNVRYKSPNSFIGWPRTQEFAMVDAGREFADASADFRFAAAVAEFGMILRSSPHRGAGTMRDVIAWANAATTSANDPRGYRHDFITLARRAQTLVR